MREARDGTTVDAVTTGRGTHADPERARSAGVAYGHDRPAPPSHRQRGGRHARRPGRRAVVTAAVAVLGLAGALATALLLWPGGEAGPQAAPTAAAPALEVASPARSVALLPGRSVTGSVLLVNRQDRPVEVGDVQFAVPTAEACAAPGVSLAPTLPPTPESPLRVPAGGTTTVQWTAFMDGGSQHACQGAALTSAVLLDGERAGTAHLTAGTLEPPPAPTGGLTTSTRAALHWGPSTAADPGWVLERTVAGTDDWQPACGSSAQHPLRTLSCTDTGLTGSTAYVYRVTLRTGHWHTTSRPSRPVTTQTRPSA